MAPPLTIRRVENSIACEPLRVDFSWGTVKIFIFKSIDLYRIFRYEIDGGKGLKPGTWITVRL